METEDRIRRESYFDFRKVDGEPVLDATAGLPPYLESILPKDKSANILDIGCGYGLLLQAFKNLGYGNGEGVDISKPSIEFCQKHGLKVQYIESIIDYCSKTDKKYDFALMTHVLEHLEKKKVIDILKSIKSILKPGGILYIATPNAQARSGAYWPYEDFTHEVIFTSGSLYYVLRSAGFNKIDFVDQDGTENSRFKFLKKILVKLYKTNDTFWNKVTGAAYHPESPRIYTWELKVSAS